MSWGNVTAFTLCELYHRSNYLIGKYTGSCLGAIDIRHHVRMIWEYHNKIRIAREVLAGKIQIISPTLNFPNKSLDQSGAFEALKNKVERLVMQSFPHIPPSLININEIRDDQGACIGMVTLFIKNFFEAKKSGVPFEEAAQKSAAVFRDGFTPDAVQMHLLWHAILLGLPQDVFDITSISTTRFEVAYPSLTMHQPTHSQIMDLPTWRECYSKKLLADDIIHAFYGSNQNRAGCIVDKTQFSKLSAGVYSVHLHYYVAPDGTIMANSTAHAVAYLIHDSRCLIFDPNIGLYSPINPGESLSKASMHEEPLFICMQHAF